MLQNAYQSNLVDSDIAAVLYNREENTEHVTAGKVRRTLFLINLTWKLFQACLLVETTTLPWNYPWNMWV